MEKGNGNDCNADEIWRVVMQKAATEKLQLIEIKSEQREGEP